MTRRSLLALAALAAACGTSPKDTSAPAGGDAPKPAATGQAIEIRMITDDRGSYFEPKDIEAKPGDVLRFTLVAGVHNAHFVADSNPGVPNLPPPTELLQLPGQTIDVPVTMAPGKRYVFVCDPHAALGMVGSVTVR